ncbi:MAG TPA: hypothetical protein VKJ65_14575 [Phycisphaerae bacterium]|nr:hypothetical protein [Phycisphaerae bacterium]
MRRNITFRSRGAFTIGEVLVWLALLSVFMLIAGQLFMFCIKAMADVDTHENNLALTNSMMQQLGRDVWTAHDCLLSDKRLVCDNGPNADLVQWVINANGDVTRNVINVTTSHSQISLKSPLSTTWPRVGTDMHFVASPLAVDVHSVANGQDSVVTLPETFKFYRSLEEDSGK